MAVALNKTGATGANAKFEAQPQACRWPRNGTPPCTGGGSPSTTRACTGASPYSAIASSQDNSLANQGDSGFIPTSDHLSDPPNGDVKSAASTNSSGFSEPASLPGQPAALVPNLHPPPVEPPPSENNHEPPPSDHISAGLSLATDTTREETHGNPSSRISLDTNQPDTLVSPNPQYCDYSSLSNGSNCNGIPNPLDPFNLLWPGSYFGDLRYNLWPEMGLREDISTIRDPSIPDCSNVPRPPPEDPATHTQPEAETGVSFESSERHCLPPPCKKRKRETITFEDERKGHQRFPSYDGAATGYQDNHNLACPFYKMNPKQYMGCGERSIGNISALGQHIRQSHKSKPHSCKDCFGAFDDATSLRLHRERGLCIATGGCAVDDLGLVPRTCKGPGATWLWYWKKLFPRRQPPPSPYTDGFDVVGQFALSAVQNVISQSALQEPLKSELIHSMLSASDQWRKHPSAPLDYSQLSKHMP